MSSHSDVIVIGGGAIGICAAYYLWKEGLKVTILERDAICSGCSYGNAGLIVPSHFIPLAAPGMIARGLKWMFNPGSPFYIKPRIDFGLLRWMWRFYRACSERRMRRAMSVLRDLSMASRALFEELAEIDGVNFGFRKNGLLMLYKGERGHSECHEMVELAQEIGVEASELNEGQVADLHPNMRINAAGGVYFKQDCHLDPAHFVNGLSRYLEQRGVDMHPFTEVVGFG
ncbi:MAG: FAD-dependent oxidoreductase, partial [Methyloligellaceae bacterium]